MSTNRFLCFFLFIFLIISCGKKEETKRIPQPEGSYFSVIRYAEDQYQILSAQPYLIQELISENGKMDSAWTPASQIAWKEVLKPFFDGDISAPEFEDQYNFFTVDDDASVSRTYYYESKEKDLYTQTLQITTDPFTGKIKSVFMEAKKKNSLRTTNYKLFYKPAEIIQVQIFKASLFGKDKTIRKEYRFL